jgi:hypothetical protein
MSCNVGGCHAFSRECCMSDECIYCDENCGGDMNAKDPSKESERLAFFRQDRNKMYQTLWSGNVTRGMGDIAPDSFEFAPHMENWIKQWKEVNGERLRILPVVQAARAVITELNGKTGLTEAQMKLRQEVSILLKDGPPKWTGETS